jgi:hypothetical protein
VPATSANLTSPARIPQARQVIQPSGFSLQHFPSSNDIGL